MKISPAVLIVWIKVNRLPHLEDKDCQIRVFTCVCCCAGAGVFDLPTRPLSTPVCPTLPEVGLSTDSLPVAGGGVQPGGNSSRRMEGGRRCFFQSYLSPQHPSGSQPHPPLAGRLLYTYGLNTPSVSSPGELHHPLWLCFALLTPL